MKICRVAGCDLVAKPQKTLCSGHYQRKARHGDVLAHIPIASRFSEFRQDTTSWISYSAAHRRVLTVRGPAGVHQCSLETCDAKADEWSYVKGSAKELTGTRRSQGRVQHLVWSADPADYRPLCRSHHRKTDHWRPVAPIEEVV